MPPPPSPGPALPLDAATRQFLKTQTQFLATAPGTKLREGVDRFSKQALSPTVRLSLDDRLNAGAGMTADWMARLPDPLLDPAAGAWTDYTRLAGAEASKRASMSLMALSAGVVGLLLGSGKTLPRAPDTLLRVAFGSDPASEWLREPFFDPGQPIPKLQGGLVLPDMADALLRGALRELIQTFARCGLSHREARQQADGIVALGQITSLTPARGCAGDRIQLAYSGLGTTAPAAGSYSDILISLPKAGGGCTSQSVRVADPAFLDPGRRWTDSGTLTITLPDSISTGCIGLLLVPAKGSAQGVCKPGDLSTAAAQFQSILTTRFGRLGTQLGQRVVDVAVLVDGRQVAWKCADCQPNQANLLRAGPPRIVEFRALEEGPIHPRGTVTLKWTVENADRVEIVARKVGSASHELPSFSTVTSMAGQVTVNITCTKRWQAEYVMVASNDNGPTCGRPIEAVVPLYSGFTHFRVGVGKVDITDERPGLPMAGFAYEQQKTLGRVLQEAQGREWTPLYARAFVMARNTRAAQPERVAIVVADLWTCTDAVRQEVLKRLPSRHGYTADNLMICGTHTHSGPGGYSSYFLYNLTIQGFDRIVFDKIVDGIVRAIDIAEGALQPGHVYVNRGKLAGCGGNRSVKAFKRNPEYLADPTIPQTDQEMVVLKFAHDDGVAAANKEVGAISWFGIHPTNLGMYNTDVSGDNKGWAAKLLEDDRQARNGSAFVGAFANGCAGDVSGNLGTGVPLGGANLLARWQVEPVADLLVPEVPAATLKRNVDRLKADIARMKATAQQQFDHASTLLHTASEEVTGDMAFGCSYVDMSQVHINGGAGARTWPAALGTSFGAGSSEDGFAVATFAGMDVPTFLIEGITKSELDAGAAEFEATLAVLLPAIVALTPIVLAATVSGPAVVPLAAGALAPALATIGTVLISNRIRRFLATVIGFAGLDGKLNDAPPGPDADGTTWRWAPMPKRDTWPAEFINGHDPKPVMLPVGLTSLIRDARGAGTDISTVACPLVPHVLPLQVWRLGGLIIAGVPAEFTGMSGLRLKRTLRQVFGSAAGDVVISNYTNGYSGYVTTQEEYAAQEYEGASTLYGPHTLAAYQQELGALAQALRSGTTRPGVAPVQPAAVFRK